MADYVDIFIADNDLVLDSAGEPLPVTDKDCIVQDIKHLIRDSGLLSACVGQRDRAIIRQLMQRLIIKIEADVRLIPGTIEITRTTKEDFFITATTIKLGVIKFEAFA